MRLIKLRKIGLIYQYVSRVVCAYAHDFWKRTGCALIGACALIRTNTDNELLRIHQKNEESKLKLRSFKISEHINEKGDGPYRGFGYIPSQ